MSPGPGKEFGPEALGPLEERLRGLSHDAPPQGLAGRIAGELAKMPAPSPPWRSRLARVFGRPRLDWGYRLATLVLLMGILAGVWLLVARRSGTSPPVPGQKGAARLAGAARPPRGGKLVSVTFAFYAPKAQSVAVVGSFNDWDPKRGSMTRGRDGNWTLQVKLPTGRYEYLFLVDGSRYEADPDAIELIPDGLGHQNAVLRL